MKNEIIEEIVEEVKDSPEVIEEVSDKTEVMEPISDKEKVDAEYKTINEKIDMPKKNNKVLIIILVIILLLDLAALAIYLIGVDKVISFIK